MSGSSTPTMVYPGIYDQPPSSRASLSSVGHMPVISEDGPRGPLPRGPLRVPQKNPRRSIGPGMPPSPSYIAPASAAAYVVPARTKSLDDDDDEDRSTAAELEQTEIKGPPSEGSIGGDEHHWFAHNRKRRCRFIIIVAVAMAVIVGLAVGLSIGLSKKDVTNGRQPGGISSGFPAGSYSFETTLQNSSTSCTSNPNTLRCFPYSDGSATTFYWVIESFNDRQKFKISSSENPFAPSFSNITMKLLDSGKDSERFVFSYSTNKTVVSSTNLTPATRATKCSYTDTTFQATLYTHRHGKNAATPPKDQNGFESWPGTVEIDEFKNATLGSPECVDNTDLPIADVQTGIGSCQCLYSS